MLLCLSRVSAAPVRTGAGDSWRNCKEIALSHSESKYGFRSFKTCRFTPLLSFLAMIWYLIHTRSRVVTLLTSRFKPADFGATFLYTILLSTFPNCEYFFAPPQGFVQNVCPFKTAPLPLFFPFYCWIPNSSEQCNDLKSRREKQRFSSVEAAAAAPSLVSSLCLFVLFLMSLNRSLL